MQDHKIVSSTGEPAYAVDRNGRIVAWNQAAEHAFGYSDSEAVGQKCFELLGGQDIFGNQYCSEHCPIREMTSRHKKVNRFQVHFKTAFHGRKKFTVSILLLHDSTGREIVVHLCRPETRADESSPTSLTRSVAPPSQSQQGALTNREYEVLTLLAEGRSTREISAVMGISIITVRNHIQHIFSKLQVHSRLEAITLSYRLGLI